MHICYFCSEYPRAGRSHGGIGRKLQVLARRFVEEGHRVSVIGLYSDADRWEDEGVQIRELAGARGFRGVRLLENRMQVKRAISEMKRTHNLDVVEFQDGNAPLIPLRSPVPVAVRFSLSHSYFAHVLNRRPRFFQARLEQFFLPRADAFASCSGFVADVTAEIFRLNREAIEVLPNPIDLSLWPVRDPSEVEPGLILFPGTVHWVKGARELAEAFIEVHRKSPSARLVFMGRDRPLRDQPGTSTVGSIRASLPQSVRGAVEFPGHQTAAEVRLWLERAAVVALPSYAEGHSNAITEAQAMGKAIVFGDRGAAREVISDGFSGLLCEPSDPEDIATKLIRILNDDGFRDSLGREARKTAEGRFSIDVLYPKNLDFYQRMLDSK